MTGAAMAAICVSGVALVYLMLAQIGAGVGWQHRAILGLALVVLWAAVSALSGVGAGSAVLLAFWAGVVRRGWDGPTVVRESNPRVIVVHARGGGEVKHG